MAEHLLQPTVSEAAARLAAYYQQLPLAAETETTAAIPRRDMAPELATLLAIDPKRALGRDELVSLLAGFRADGEPIRGKVVRPDADRIAYVDFCFSADKSVSVAWAFAPTHAEQNIVARAHIDAVGAALLHLEGEIGRARRGKGGRGGADAGHTAWVRFDHYTSRPTERAMPGAHSAETSEDNSVGRVAGDPQLHSHGVMLNVVLAGTRVGSLDTGQLDGRIKEAGALYQAYLATNLRRHGVEVELDPETGAARLTAIPEAVRSVFSKRVRGGTDAAQAYAEARGIDWNSLDARQRAALIKQGTQGDRTLPKRDDQGNPDAWQREAGAMEWRHASVLAPNRAGGLPSAGERLETAYQVACDLLGTQFANAAVLGRTNARVAAARGLIASGIKSSADVDHVVQMFAERGIRQEGQDVGLVCGHQVDRRGRHQLALTTTLHVDRERELIALARKAAGDMSGALSESALTAAVDRSEHDFVTPHGQRQRGIMDVLGRGGRFAIAIGVAGSGKTALLSPLVDAWLQEGYTVYGAALAWRQSADLAGAGIPEDNLLAIAALLTRADRGSLDLTDRSVVVVDELGLLGTSQALELLQLQKKYGFRLVAVGDEQQCQAVEAGPVIDLLREALGPEAVPELLSTVRQTTERERQIASLFREGRAADALNYKRVDGRAEAVPGGYDEAVERVATLWQERRDANAHDPSYSLTVSVPTNADTRAVSAAIRVRRRSAGEIDLSETVLDAIDLHGTQYGLPIAIGDRVRLFKRTNASTGSRGIIGNNGTVLDVRQVTGAGLVLRNPHGRQGLVRWDTLRDPFSGRILLSYGDALTIHSAQGVTSTEHIQAMPAGSRSVDGYRAYVAASRHRRATWLVTSEGEERRDVMTGRPFDDSGPIGVDEIWANVARNLSRKPAKARATALMETAYATRQDAVRALQSGLHLFEMREHAGQKDSGRAPGILPDITVPGTELALENHASGQRGTRQETGTLGAKLLRHRRAAAVMPVAKSLLTEGENYGRLLAALHGLGEQIGAAVRQSVMSVIVDVARSAAKAPPLQPTVTNEPKLPTVAPPGATDAPHKSQRRPSHWKTLVGNTLSSFTVGAERVLEDAVEGVLDLGAHAIGSVTEAAKHRLKVKQQKIATAKKGRESKAALEREIDRRMAGMPPYTERWMVRESTLAEQERRAAGDYAESRVHAMNASPLQKTSPEKPSKTQPAIEKTVPPPATESGPSISQERTPGAGKPETAAAKEGMTQASGIPNTTMKPGFSKKLGVGPAKTQGKPGGRGTGGSGR